jgi:hypothetical protein
LGSGILAGEANHIAQRNFARRERRNLLIRSVIWQRVEDAGRAKSVAREGNFASGRRFSAPNIATT